MSIEAALVRDKLFKEQKKNLILEEEKIKLIIENNRLKEKLKRIYEEFKNDKEFQG